MTAKVLDGRAQAKKIKEQLTLEIKRLYIKHNTLPGLAIVRVGNDKPSQVYVASKCKQCEEIGLLPFEHHFKDTATEHEILNLIHRLNVDPQVHGIIVQLPLPSHLSVENIISAIDPLKDVDGLHPLNMGRLACGMKSYIPCTPSGCMLLLQSHLKKLQGLQAVIVGRSNLVGKPMGLLLLNEGCTVTFVHRKTHNLQEICRQADILVVAAGSPLLVKSDWVKPGAVILDVGINSGVHKGGESFLVGDVDFDQVSKIAGAISPVPGGVGPMTVACLLRNTVQAFKDQMAHPK